MHTPTCLNLSITFAKTRGWVRSHHSPPHPTQFRVLFSVLCSKTILGSMKLTIERGAAAAAAAVSAMNMNDQEIHVASVSIETKVGMTLWQPAQSTVLCQPQVA